MIIANKNCSRMRINGHKIIPNQFKNSFVLLHDKSIVSVKNISGNAVKVHKYRAMKPLFKYPTSSSLLDSYAVDIYSIKVYSYDQ